ncbi:hypothetical protein [Brevibacillus agri]|nr:hypothetical protein [Brevibacillus agri]MCG5252842.1 hypothetical protein [Brevibacillus agri]
MNKYSSISEPGRTFSADGGLMFGEAFGGRRFGMTFGGIGFGLRFGGI